MRKPENTTFNLINKAAARRGRKAAKEKMNKTFPGLPSYLLSGKIEIFYRYIKNYPEKLFAPDGNIDDMIAFVEVYNFYARGRSALNRDIVYADS